MTQNAKDSQGGKTHPVKETADNAAKKSDKGLGKGSADHKKDSPTGSHNKGEKKTTHWFGESLCQSMRNSERALGNVFLARQ